MLQLHHLVLFSTLLGSFVVSAKTGKEEMELTPDQQTKLDALKSGLDQKMKDHPHFGHEVVQKQFLAHHNWDVKAAKGGIEEGYKWDTTNRAIGKDAVADDAYAGLKDRIGGIMDAVDKENRPILFLKVNKWEWSEAIKTGEMEKWKRTFYRMMDEGANKTLANFDAGTGTHVRFYVIADYVWWDLERGTCPLCMTEIAEIARRFESRWPRIKSHVIIINTPPTWTIILNLIKPIFSKETNEALKVHGQEKKQWFPLLQKDISDEELAKLPLDDTEKNSPHPPTFSKMMGMGKK